MATLSSTLTTCLLIVLLSISSTTIASSHHHTAALAPSVDCTTLIVNLADCLSFLSTGSKGEKPQSSCCKGLKIVLETNAQCFCEVFKNDASLGVTLNITKASTLPSACKLHHAPSVSNCGSSLAPPFAAPGVAPGGAVAAGPAGALAPNHSPKNVASSSIQISLATVIIGLLFVLVSYLF